MCPRVVSHNPEVSFKREFSDADVFSLVKILGSITQSVQAQLSGVSKLKIVLEVIVKNYQQHP